MIEWPLKFSTCKIVDQGTFSIFAERTLEITINGSIGAIHDANHGCSQGADIPMIFTFLALL